MGTKVEKRGPCKQIQTLASTGLDGEIDLEEDEYSEEQEQKTLQWRSHSSGEIGPEAKPEQGAVAERVEREHLLLNSESGFDSVWNLSRQGMLSRASLAEGKAGSTSEV